MGPSSYIDPEQLEQPLSEKDHKLRVEFVRAFMRTRNAYAACVELGFMEAYAKDWANVFMREGVVRRLISEAEREEDTEQAARDRRRNYRAWMENLATDNSKGSSHAARVAAVAHLMKIEGMGVAAANTEHELTHKGGVMIVPAVVNYEKWGEAASKSQANLKKTVKD